MGKAKKALPGAANPLRGSTQALYFAE